MTNPNSNIVKPLIFAKLLGLELNARLTLNIFRKSMLRKLQIYDIKLPKTSFFYPIEREKNVPINFCLLEGEA